MSTYAKNIINVLQIKDTGTNTNKITTKPLRSNLPSVFHYHLAILYIPLTIQTSSVYGRPVHADRLLRECSQMTKSHRHRQRLHAGGAPANSSILIVMQRAKTRNFKSANNESESTSSAFRTTTPTHWRSAPGQLVASSEKFLEFVSIRLRACNYCR